MGTPALSGRCRGTQPKAGFSEPERPGGDGAAGWLMGRRTVGRSKVGQPANSRNEGEK